jgi:hypothetical protein
MPRLDRAQRIIVTITIITDIIVVVVPLKRGWDIEASLSPPSRDGDTGPFIIPVRHRNVTGSLETSSGAPRFKSVQTEP